MKKIISLLISAVLAVGLLLPALAADTEAEQAAEKLHMLGLFNGVGTDAKTGKPDYDLDSIPTRAQAVTMLVRLLGKEEAAKAGKWTTPFTDVPDWAQPYVGYAYENGLTNGTGASTFGSSANATAAMYLTFVLRALGYESGKDFAWDHAWELTDQLGITNGEYNADTKSFLRGDVAAISAAALSAELKDGSFTLGEKLQKENNIDPKLYAKAMGTQSAAPTVEYSLYDFTYAPELGGYRITGFRFDRSTGYAVDGDTLLIPAEYEGKPVVAIHAVIHSNAVTISIPDTIIQIRENAFENIPYCTAFTVDPANPAFCAVDGVLMSAGGRTLVRYPEARPGSSYTIPDSVTEVRPFAFRAVSPLSRGDTGDYAHELKSIVLPKTVQYVGANAFNLDYLSLYIEGDASAWDGSCFAAMELQFPDLAAQGSAVTEPMKAYEGTEYQCAVFTAVRTELTHGVTELRLHCDTDRELHCMVFNSGRNSDAGFGCSHNFPAGSSDFCVYLPTEAYAQYEALILRERIIENDTTVQTCLYSIG